MGVAEYHYRTLAGSGSVRLTDKSIVSDFNLGFRSWQDEVPKCR
jgi:hypothetical protein